MTDLFDWFLGLLPSWIIYSIIITGAILFVLEVFTSALLPFGYGTLIKFVAVFLFASGFYLQGRHDILVRGKEVVEKIVVQEKIVTKVVKEKFQEKQKQIEDHHEKVITVIDTFKGKADTMCVIPESFVSVHNMAANPTDTQSPIRIDDPASSVKISEVERTIADNYETYHKVANQLEQLQSWVKQIQEIRK